MNEKHLMKWGGICAFAFAVLFFILEVIFFVSQGITTQTPTVGDMTEMMSSGAYRTVVVLLGISLFLFVVVLYAVYDYLRKTSHGLSRAGFGFATLFVFLFFMYWIFSNTGTKIALSGSSDFEIQLDLIMTLLGSLIIPFMWAFALYSVCWGLACIKIGGNAKTAGYTYLVTAVCALLYYVFSLIGIVIITSIVDIILVIAFIVTYFFIGLVLTAEAKKA